ncbi:MAG: hypothetical protein ACI3VN_03255 [Candidatus Onthomonas sp.]
MRREDFRRMLDLVEERYIREAEDWRPRQSSRWKRWAALAACLCAVLGLGWFALLGGRAGSAGGSSCDTAASAAEEPAEAPEAAAEEPNEAGIPEEDGSEVFDSYAGPVLPLTLAQEQTEITAYREITLNCQREEGMDVTDQYTLTNTSEEDQTVTLLYPFAARLENLELPQLTIDGTEAGYTLYQGSAAVPRSLLGTWQGYRDLLADGSYAGEAVNRDWSLTDPVTVYWFQNWDASAAEGEAPTLQLSGTVAPGQTTLLTYGLEGGSWDNETGSFSVDFSVPEPGSKPDEGLKCLIAWGDAPQILGTQGYQNGGCKPGEETEITCQVVREETSWDQLLPRLLKDSLSQYAIQTPEELLYAAVCQQLASGRLEATGYLEDLIFDSLSRGRVCYLAAETTIPAGESVTVTAQFLQSPSYNFIGEQNDSLEGYDLLTSAGSNLTFTGLTARLTGFDSVELTGQNYGFEPEQGITEVPLALETEHYYLEFRRAGGENP